MVTVTTQAPVDQASWRTAVAHYQMWDEREHRPVGFSAVKQRRAELQATAQLVKDQS